MFGPCFVMHYLVSFLVTRKKELFALLIVFMDVSVLWLFIAVPWVGL